MAISQNFNITHIPIVALKEFLSDFDTTIDRYCGEREVWLKVGQKEVIDSLTQFIDEVDDVS